MNTETHTENLDHIPPHLQFKHQQESKYPLYAMSQVIRLQMSLPDHRKREEYWKNVYAYNQELEKLMKGKDIDRDEIDLFDIIDLMNAALENTFPELKRYEGLEGHLVSVFKHSQELLIGRHGALRAPEILNTDQIKSLFLAAAVHDLLKYLEVPQGNILADHEQVTKHLMLRHFGNIEGISDQVKFAAEIVGDHENIYKEEIRQASMFSENPVERAKAMFFLADSLTGVLNIEDQSMHIDRMSLEKRFGKLYFKHLDLATGKVFRPEWGVYAMKDYVETISYFEKIGFDIDKGWREILYSSALSPLKRALSENRGGVDQVYSNAQEERVLGAIDEFESELKKISQSEWGIFAIMWNYFLSELKKIH